MKINKDNISPFKIRIECWPVKGKNVKNVELVVLMFTGHRLEWEWYQALWEECWARCAVQGLNEKKAHLFSNLCRAWDCWKISLPESLRGFSPSEFKRTSCWIDSSLWLIQLSWYHHQIYFNPHEYLSISCSCSSIFFTRENHLERTFFQILPCNLNINQPTCVNVALSKARFQGMCSL